MDWIDIPSCLIPKKGNAKECSNYCIIALNSHDSKVVLKILQASEPAWCEPRTSRCMWSEPHTKNFQMFKLDLEKAKEPEIKLPTSIES